ncbi:glycogen-binding domain-containing protein [Nitratifractor sp.]
MIKITRRGKKAWVTFTAPYTDCENVMLKGSWNDWEPEAMKQKKNGEFYLMKILPIGRSYEFGYLVDGQWTAEEDLPAVPTPFGSRNALLEL